MANLGYIQLTRACVQSCRFCSNPPTGMEMDEAHLVAEIDHLVSLDYDGVIFTGGEPTISPLLFPALRHAAERGLQSRIITNGQRLADADFFRRCVEAGLGHLHVSLHSHRAEVHDFVTRSRGSWRAAVGCLGHVPGMGVTCDVNSVINAYNADHLDESVMWLCDRFPFLRHFVWNNMDPEGNRAEDNPDCIPRHHEMLVSLERAMDFLERTGRSFRAERVPLCFMRRHPWASTETRKIIKEEERSIRFLDGKGLVRQAEFLHGKGAACDACHWDPICAGMYSLAVKYDEGELSPVFDDPLPVIERVLGKAPTAELTERILARRGRRSPSEQPSEAQRAAALQRSRSA